MPATTSPPALSFHEVGFAPEGGAIFSGVNWTVPRGSLTFLAGRSGGGKSSLLRMANRLIERNSGGIAIAGRPIEDWPIRALRQHVVYIPQRPALLAPQVGQDLRLPLSWRGRDAAEETLRRTLNIAQLADLALGRPTDKLSEGERARLGVARGLLLEPQLMLLDEPTASLDPPTASALLRALQDWARAEYRTLVIISHRLQEPLTLLADTAFLLAGQLHGPYPAAALRAGQVSDAVQSFCAGSGSPATPSPSQSPADAL